MFKQFTGGSLGSNTFVVWDGGDGASNEAMIIDTGNRIYDVERFVKAENLKVKYIVLTHGHYDHVCFIEDFCAAFPDAKVVCHEDESKVLSDPEANVSALFGDPKSYRDADIKVKEGDTLALGRLVFTVMHTPGHTPGGICLYNDAEKQLFTGDTLFAGGYGRTDFKHGSGVELMRSLRRILAMDEDISFHAGHGEMSKIGWERY